MFRHNRPNRYGPSPWLALPAIAVTSALVQAQSLPCFARSQLGRVTTETLTYTFLWDVGVDDSRACTANDELGVRVYDVSDPAAPVWIGALNLDADIYRVIVRGPLAYVTAGLFAEVNGSTSAVITLDLSGDRDPVQLGQALIPDYPVDLDVDGTLAAAALRSGGLQLIDISDPLDPVPLGLLPTPGNPTCVSLVGNTLYAIDDTLGLLVVDVSDPSAPTLLGSTPEGVGATALDTAGTTVLAASAGVGLHVFDASTPGSPHLAGSFPRADRGRVDVQTAGGLAYLSNSRSDEIIVIDTSDPASPTVDHRIYAPGGTHGLAVHGRVAYAASGTFGLQTFTLDGPDTPSPKLAEIATSGTSTSYDDTRELLLDGETAYIAANEYIQSDEDFYQQRVFAVDISDPAQPAVLGSKPLGPVSPDEIALRMAARDGHLFLSRGGSGLQVLDVRDPESMVAVALLAIPEFNVRDVALAGDLAFLSGNRNEFPAPDPGDPDPTVGLQIVDISDPSDPVVRSAVPTPGRAWAVEASGSYVFLADRDRGLYVFDATDPDSPSLIAGPVPFEEPGPSLDGMRLVENRLLVPLYSGGIEVFDVSTPSNPLRVESLHTTPDTRGIAVRADRAYLASHNGGMQILDLATPGSARWVATYAEPNNTVRDIEIRGDYAFLIDRNARLTSVNISEDCTPCPADLNGDSILDSGDIQTFIALFLDGNTAVDLNGDGILDSGDIQSFVTAFLAGC